MVITVGTSVLAISSAAPRSAASLTSRDRRMAAAWSSTPLVASMAKPLGTRKLRP